MLILGFTVFLSLLSVGASAFPPPIVYQAPVTLENIAVRASSQLLLTSATSPTLFTFDPTAVNGTFTAVHTFPNVTSLTGIVEYRPGVFALFASIINATTRRAAPNSTSLWSVDFTAQTPLVREIGALPQIPLANGLTALPGAPDVLLCADSLSGAVWQLDARTGAARVAIEDATMLPDGPPPATGINGLHIRSNYLYFTNSQLGTFSRVALGFKGGKVTAAGAVQRLATVPQIAGKDQQQPDDFALDARGRAWVTVHPGAVTVFSPAANWTQTTVLGNLDGNDTALIHPTAAAFGRGSAAQRETLYVVTAAGQVVALDTSGY
ncbi:hypothetical protein C8R46DRAFT_1196634 [Mycena filopes]|nr:hypothetical protein C8R46DRAFT_1196634 [Mycena filopes]